MRRLSALLLILSLSACTEATSPDTDATPSLKALVSRSTITIDLAGLVTPNDCTGEMITIEQGTLTERVQLVVTGAEDTVVRIHQTAHASGFSDLGVRYNLHLATSATQIDIGATNGMILSVPFMLQIVGQGPSNNSYIHSIVHISTNAAGTLTSHVDLGRAGCR
ncbi:MAG TPA: hypothetical protein VK922_05365 [Gemmatimonadaceae bacterium]|nr:hypothetical protein [Gemmatimonadaceae bacterium]